MTKQTKPGGPYVGFLPDAHRIYQFGWDGSGYRHLAENGRPIADWAGHEQHDFSGKASTPPEPTPGRRCSSSGSASGQPRR